MRRRSAWFVAGCLLAAVAGCSTGPPMAKGCTPPRNEDELLAAYRAEPVFDVRPPESVSRAEPIVGRGCRDDGDGGATPTEVRQHFTLHLTFPQDRLAELYDAGLRDRDWRPEPAGIIPRQANGDAQAGLRYCKHVEGVPSILSVYERYSDLPNHRAVAVSPSPGDAWPEAGTIYVSITAGRGYGCATG